MMTTVQALVWSGILTFLMLLVASAFCAKVWEPGGPMIAFGNREGMAPPVGMAGRADRSPSAASAASRTWASRISRAAL